MCGRAYSPRQLWMWPNARISVMGGEQAASVLLQVKMDQLAGRNQVLTPQEQVEFKRPTLETYEREGSPYYSSSRLWTTAFSTRWTRAWLSDWNLCSLQRANPGNKVRSLPM